MNNKQIEQAKPGDTIWDDKVKGLHLRAFANQKVYYLYYRTKEYRQRKPKIGRHGDITLTEAREIARDYLGKVAAGRDPMAEMEARRDGVTMSQLAERFLKYIKEDPKDKVKDRTRTEYKKVLDRVILPKWGRKLVVDLTDADIDDLHRGMHKTPYQANRILALLSRMMNLAEAWGIRPKNSNPCSGVSRYEERKRRRHMTGDEAPKIAAALAKYEESRPQAALFIHLLILTGARPDEIARAKRNQIHRIETDEGVVRHYIDIEEHKTERHGEIRRVYLPNRVIELLDKVPATKDGSLTGIQSPRDLWETIRREAGCPDLRLYDLRRTFASAALRLGYTLDQIGELLGHTSGTTTKRYAWLMDEIRAEASNATADLLGLMMEGKKKEEV